MCRAVFPADRAACICSETDALGSRECTSSFGDWRFHLSVATIGARYLPFGLKHAALAKFEDIAKLYGPHSCNPCSIERASFEFPSCSRGQGCGGAGLPTELLSAHEPSRLHVTRQLQTSVREIQLPTSRQRSSEFESIHREGRLIFLAEDLDSAFGELPTKLLPNPRRNPARIGSGWSSTKTTMRCSKPPESAEERMRASLVP